MGWAVNVNATFDRVNIQGLHLVCQNDGIKSNVYNKNERFASFLLEFCLLSFKMDMLTPRVRKNRFFGQNKCVPLAGILIDVFYVDSRCLNYFFKSDGFSRISLGGTLNCPNFSRMV